MADCKGMRSKALLALGMAACVSGTLAGAQPALAQVQSQRDRAIGERDRQESIAGGATRRELPPSLGEIRLLQPTDLFYVVIDPEVEYTDNAFYSRGGDQDVIFNPSASIGVQTEVADLVEVELEMGLQAFYYDDNSVLDSVNPYWNLEFYGDTGPVELEFDLTYSISYETAFSGRDHSALTTTLTAYWPIDITDSFTIEPFALAQRSFRTPSPSQFWLGEVGVEFAYSVTSKLYLEVDTFIAYGENDNQFNTTFGKTPDFLTMAGQAEISYALLPWLNAGLNFAFFRNESNIPGSSYDRLSVGPSLYSEFRF